MQIKCKFNRIDQINDNPTKVALREVIYLEDDYELGIKIDKIYDVYGIYFHKTGAMYLICEEDDDLYPIGSHASFFEIVDSSMPIDWVFVYNDIDESYLVPKIWAEDPMFYENLLNGNKKEEDIFKMIKKAHEDCRGE